jgi:hypothetical protein
MPAMWFLDGSIDFLTRPKPQVTVSTSVLKRYRGSRNTNNRLVPDQWVRERARAVGHNGAITCCGPRSGEIVYEPS